MYNNDRHMKLESHLCFPLYAAARETMKLYRPYLEPLGLTYTQYIALLVIWEVKSISVKDLGKRLYLDSGTLTPVLKSLEGKGYITRFRSTEDERVLIVELTDSGVELREKAFNIPIEMAAKIKNFTREEMITLYHMLYKLLENAEK